MNICSKNKHWNREVQSTDNIYENMFHITTLLNDELRIKLRIYERLIKQYGSCSAGYSITKQNIDYWL